MEEEVKEFIKNIVEQLKTEEDLNLPSGKHELPSYVSTAEILLDLKILLDGIFEAELYDNGDCLELDFPNGQKFLIKAEEVSDLN